MDIAPGKSKTAQWRWLNRRMAGGKRAPKPRPRSERNQRLDAMPASPIQFWAPPAPPMRRRPEHEKPSTLTTASAPVALACQECSGTHCEPRLHGTSARTILETRTSQAPVIRSDTGTLAVLGIRQETPPPPRTLQKSRDIGRTLSHKERIAARYLDAKMRDIKEKYGRSF